MKQKINLFLKGMSMGIAEVIPGVSGGTIAFITGIYKELIDTIKAFNLEAIKYLKQGEFGKLTKHLNINFLVILILGMMGGILIGVYGVTHMLEEYPVVLWAFFFGLILASVPMMMSTVKEVNANKILVFISGAIIAYFITSLSPAQGSGELWYIFLAGMIAIVALVLPGVSGSFILLLLGVYTVVIPKVKSFLDGPNMEDLLLLVVFAGGCLVGLLFFVRLVSKAFDNHYELTVSIMSGFMLGSLNKIWPWRNPTKLLNKDSQEIINVDSKLLENFQLTSENIKILKENNVLPSQYFDNPMVLPSILAAVLGIVLIILLQKNAKK